MTAPVIHFVLCDLGHDLGKTWIERDIARMGRAETIADIRDKQITDVVQVIEVEFGCPGISSRDVTEEFIAAAGQPMNPFHRSAMNAFDRLMADLDHERDLRKHVVM
jgi:hypothetical protein